MITGRWGKPSEVLLDVVVEADGAVRGIVNPGRQHAPIRAGHFDAVTGAVRLEGDVVRAGESRAFVIEGRLDGRTLRLAYEFGDVTGAIDIVRVEEYVPPRRTVADRLRGPVAGLLRRFYALSRPSGRRNARRLRARGESLDSIVLRDAVAADIPALAELHVTLWNRTYRTSRGPTVATRASQWRQRFAKSPRPDFTLVLEDRRGRLIGFVAAEPHDGEFDGVVSKIYLRWEYHGLGLGRRMMTETARRFVARGIGSCVLFAEPSNPSVGFYDRMGGERLRDEHGRFTGAYAWRDVRTLLEPGAPLAGMG
jgi:ribosomal protein S18 acetylase RimI-like enzyme